MTELLTMENLIALLTLASLEIVLGIDNIVFLAILTGKLPPEQRLKAQRIGLMLAMFMRIGLLLSIKWIMGLTAPILTVFHHSVSGRDLILLIGGLFLLAKATHEIHEKLEGAGHTMAEAKPGRNSFGAILAQIVAIDLVFSLDSVITAVGMAKHVEIMIVAIIISVAIMMWFAGPVSRFVEKHPTIKMLALAFLLMIGVMLVAEGFHKHIERGYVYFAMAFSLFVEVLNIRATKKQKLHDAGGPA